MVERLSEQFTKLVGPEAFAHAEAAIAAAKAAAEAAAKAAAEKAAAAAAVAKSAAAAATPKPAVGPAGAAVVAGLAEPGRPGSPTPATANPAPPPLGARLPAAGAASAAPAARPAAAAAVPPRPPVSSAVPPPVVAPLPTLPVQVTSHAAKGYHFDAAVAPAQVVEAAELLAAEGFALDTITGVDWIAQNEMEVVYDYFHPVEFLRVVVRARVPRATPELPSITAVFPGANWHERETHDFFGIRFTGHPNLKPFLLPEDANFHPLRKDYQP